MITRRKLFGLGAGALAGATSLTIAGTSHAAQAFRFHWTAFDAARAAGGPLLADIPASWCSTCQVQQAIVTELVAEPRYSGYKIFVVAYDTQKDVMRQFGARQRSTLIAFNGSTETGRVVGDTRRSSIETLLESAV